MMALKHQPRARRKMLSAMRQVERSDFTPDVPLLFLTDPKRTPDILATVSRFPEGSGVIYRHFGLPERFEMAHDLVNLCRSRNSICLIGADPELALSVSAHGVHWPEAKLSEARHYRGAFTYQTASAHSRRAIWRAHLAGMDAALVSAVFPSKSLSAGKPMGPSKFRTLAQNSPLPIYALGGMDANNAARVAAHAGIAAIEGVLMSF
jgi:thiamine-phosphate pyrophosphorylase